MSRLGKYEIKKASLNINEAKFLYDPDAVRFFDKGIRLRFLQEHYGKKPSCEKLPGKFPIFGNTAA